MKSEDDKGPAAPLRLQAECRHALGEVGIYFSKRLMHPLIEVSVHTVFHLSVKIHG
jgi:hypothetical protein